MGIWDDIKTTFRNGNSLTRLIYINIAFFIDINFTREELAELGIEIKAKEIIEIGYNFIKLNFIDDIKKMYLQNF